MSRLVAASMKHQKYTIDLTNKYTTSRKDFMSYLLSGRTRVSDIQLAAHASDFVIAGSETTATTLAVVFYYLCNNASVKQQLEEEILSAFPAYKDINATSVAKLKYLHAVCLEVLRIFPPLPLGLPREVPHPGKVVGGFYVPGRTIVSTNHYAASMGTDNFDKPEAFMPRRWLTGEPTDILEASKPFSCGPRSCLGRGLIYKNAFVLLNENLDWNRESKMHLLWQKPKLLMELTKRSWNRMRHMDHQTQLILCSYTRCPGTSTCPTDSK
ncbi:cytochrome P450 [Metarhizium robertsii]|uniref:Cytochrome P450 n=1 Tax=Metarhizium robertsii TaxID=568076 RepID=A0A014P9P7_9HYPO|nr:cytochrome P450 [Metarhizium robertsii]